MTDREHAWDAIHERLAPGGHTAPPTFDPATRRWSVTALGPKLGGRRGPAPATVTGEGPRELAALSDLAERLTLAPEAEGGVGPMRRSCALADPEDIT